MKFRTVLLAALAACAASTGAFAASGDAGHPTTREGWSDRCASLDAQFDGLVDKFKSDAHFGAANELHTAGIAACAANDAATGVTKLEEALRKLGIEPAS